MSTSSHDKALSPRRSDEPNSGSRRIDPETVIRDHQEGLWRYLRALGCDSALAEDLVQDTLITVLRTEIEDQGEAALGAYLRKVARNLFISRQRREKRVRTVAEVEEIETEWQEWVRDDSGDAMLDALRDCLGRLSERAQLALRLRFRERSSRSEIADALTMTEHGAKNLMQRAKTQLKDCIEAKVK